MSNDYEERIHRLPTSLMDKESAARAHMTASEDTYYSLQELQKINKNLEEINQNQNKEKTNRQVIDTAQIPGVRFNVVEYDSSYVGDLSLEPANITHNKWEWR